MYKSTQMHGLIVFFSSLAAIFSLFLLYTLSPDANHNTKGWRGHWCILLAATNMVCLPKRLPPLLHISHKSVHGHHRGWWPVLSPSPPHWANWKRKVPPAVNACPRGYACSGYEQLINNYCFYRPSRGTCHIYRMVRVLKRVCSLNYCWNSVFE